MGGLVVGRVVTIVLLVVGTVVATRNNINRLPPRGHNALSLPVDVMCIWRRHLGKAPLPVQLNGSDTRKYTKKFIARLLVDVETQIIPHFKPEEELYPTKN